MKKTIFRLLLWLAFAAAAALSAAAAADPSAFDFYARGPYRPAVPRPETLRGFEVGARHTAYAEMESYLRAVAAAAPDRVRIFEIGRTTERRTQYLIAVSAPSNIARLDALRADYRRLADPRALDAAGAARLAAELPVAVWLAYTIHGNETASFETMMQVLYQLAASDETATRAMLDGTVALIVAGGNPDGYERFAAWYNSVAVGNPDPQALEHREPWSVEGRLNRYRFDLNRDNLAATQIETRNLQTAFFDWNPQVSADHHGQPSQYFFPPNAEPYNPNLPAADTAKWLTIFGRANAAAFDRRRWDYYTGDVFDLFYPGYWDSFPALTGATAMTYETDGGGFKGLRWRRDDGTIATFREAIAKHFTASLTTLETAAAHRAERLADYYRFRREAIAEGRAERFKRFVIVPAKDPFKAAELVEILRRARIEVRVAERGFRSARAVSHLSAETAGPVEFPPGSYFVDLAQPQKRLAKALLEPETPADPKFVAEEIATFRRNERRGSAEPRDYYRFYDITAWSLPLAFGLDAYRTEDAAPVADAPLVTDGHLQAARTGGIRGDDRAAVAYLIPYAADLAPALAMRLLADGHRVHYAARRLNAGGRDYPAGTFVVRLSRNAPTVRAALEKEARAFGLSVVPVASGFIEAGDTGIGSENVLPLRPPKIAVAAGEGVTAVSFGAIWWTLDRAGVEFTALDLGSLDAAALRDYTVLVLPDGRAGAYAGVLKSLKEWIDGGGTVVCLKGAAAGAITAGLSTARIVGAADDEDGRPSSGATPTAEPDEEPPFRSPTARAGRVPESLPGAIFRARLDPTSYLSFGYSDTAELPVLLSGDRFFRPSKAGVNAAVFRSGAAGGLKIAGFVWPDNTERLLDGTAYLIDERAGAGRVVMFAEDPLFRGLFRSGTRLFFNALLFAPVN